VRVSIRVTSHDGTGLGEIVRAADQAGADTVSVTGHLIQGRPGRAAGWGDVRGRRHRG
jgi:hypothetical protein